MALEDLRAALIAAVGPTGLIDDPTDLAFYGADRCRGGWPVRPSLVVFPRAVAEVQAVVRACAAHGVPMELYCFTATTNWGDYEAIQSNIFDHLLAILPEFGLRPFQNPSGSDLQALLHHARGGDAS